MREIKCTHCGSKDLLPFDVSLGSSYYAGGDGDNIYTESNVNKYICSECGHAELFVTEKALAAYFEKIAEDKKQVENLHKFEKDRKVLQEKIENLESVIADENSTVKAVREAKEKLLQYKNELRTLRLQKANHSGRWIS